MNPQRLRWRCRRGLRELDLLLTGYLDSGYPESAPEEQKRFHHLLESPDNMLWGYFFQDQPPGDPQLAKLIQRIRGAATPHP
jgi:antitoxin CptB